LWVTGIPANATVALDSTPTPPSRVGGEPDWSQVPLTFTSGSGKQYLSIVIPRVPPGTLTRRVTLTVPDNPAFQLRAALTPPWVDGTVLRGCLTDGGVITNAACMGTQLTAINAYLASTPGIAALSGSGVWAKIGWQCEGAGTLPSAVAKAEQVLDFMV